MYTRTHASTGLNTKHVELKEQLRGVSYLLPLILGVVFKFQVSQQIPKFVYYLYIWGDECGVYTH